MKNTNSNTNSTDNKHDTRNERGQFAAECTACGAGTSDSMLEKCDDCNEASHTGEGLYI